MSLIRKLYETLRSFLFRALGREEVVRVGCNIKKNNNNNIQLNTMIYSVNRL